MDQKQKYKKGQTHNIHAEANAGGGHDESPHAGGGHDESPLCGEGLCWASGF